MSLQAGRDLNCSLAEKKRLMRELSAARAVIEEINILLRGRELGRINEARKAARQYLKDRGLL